MKKFTKGLVLGVLCAFGSLAVWAEAADPVFRISVYGEGNAAIPLGDDNKDNIDLLNDNSLLFNLGGGFGIEFGLPFKLAGFQNGISFNLGAGGLLPTSGNADYGYDLKTLLGYWVRFPLGSSDFFLQPELSYGFLSKTAGFSNAGTDSHGTDLDQLAQIAVSLRWAPENLLGGHVEFQLAPEFGIETYGHGHDTEHNIYAGARLGALIVFGDNKGVGTAAQKKAEEARVQRTENQVQAMNLQDVSVSQSDLGLTLSLINIRFLPDSAELEPDELVKLDKLSTLLKKTRKDLLVTGHCAATTDTESDMEVSVERAKTVADYLISKGVRTAQHITSRGKGSTEPIGDNYTEEGRIKNRRVEITILEPRRQPKQRKTTATTASTEVTETTAED